MALPEIGSVWREDYDYGTHYVRRVKVVGYADDGRVLIKNITDGGRVTRAKPERFGKARGYKHDAHNPASGAGE